MFWQEESKEKKAVSISSRVSDLCFKITCRSLPVDHNWALREALGKELSWLLDEPLVAIHAIHGAASGNGWMRPDNHDDLIYLSLRTRLRIRLPNDRIKAAKHLENRHLDIAGHTLTIGASSTSPLTHHKNLFVRYLPDSADNEDSFLAGVMSMLRQKGIYPPRIMAGKKHIIRTPAGNLNTRSIMVDGLDPSSSLLLQEEGIGRQRCLGCGIFLPHKSIDAVYSAGSPL